MADNETEKLPEWSDSEGPTASVKLAEGSGFEGPTVSDKLPEGSGFEGPTASDKLPEGSGSEGPTVSEKLPEESGSEGPTGSDKLPEGSGSEGPTASDKLPEESGSEGPTVSEKLPEGSGSEGPTASDKLPEESGSEGPTVSEKLPEGSGSEGPTASDKPPEGSGSTASDKLPEGSGSEGSTASDKLPEGSGSTASDKLPEGSGSEGSTASDKLPEGSGSEGPTASDVNPPNSEEGRCTPAVEVAVVTVGVESLSLPHTSPTLEVASTSGSQVDTALPNDLFEKKQRLLHPLTLAWSFGFNSRLPVHNISEGNRKMVFYASAHTGVLFDCVRNQQHLLQGHSNCISCMAVSGDKRWLVTADIGTDCMLTVWDSFSGIPVRNIFDGLGEGTVAIAMSSDAQYIATISTGEETQVVSVWEWTVDSDTPMYQIALGEDFSFQTFLTFHPEDPHQLISNSLDMVVFYYWEGKEMKFDSHPILSKEFNRTLGAYSQSVLVPQSSLALTGTTEGNGVLWRSADANEPHVKRALKLMKMHNCAISVVTSVMNMVVTGDVKGRIQFFDSDLKMLNWYDDCMRFGPLCSLSFSYNPKIPVMKYELDMGRSEIETLGEHSYPAESTKPALPFIIPDFIISTSSSCIAHVTANGSLTEIVLREHDASVNALAAHPFLPRLLVGSYSGRLKLWDYMDKIVLASTEICEPDYLQCVSFDPKAEYIGAGFTNGTLQVLDPITLSEVGKSFRYSRDAITHISFSHDSSYLATADLDMCVTVYVAQPLHAEQPWQFLAKYRSHYKTINDLLFGVKLDSNFPRLLSLGKDRTMVEYDLEHSSKDDLVLLSVVRIEQSATPMAMTWYPPLTKESFILLANNQYKIKLINSTTNMCRKTLLGPVYGSSLKKVMVLPSPEMSGKRCLVYATTRNVGLLLLPHDGNPHNSKCLVAHPGKVANLACSFDGKYVFSAGGEDYTVNMWIVYTDALEVASLLGGEDLKPFYAMLEGGQSGRFFSEIEEFFYYAQIRSQGPDVTSTREVSLTIPIEEIANVMRAIGFYPSEQEVEDMKNEIKFSRYMETGRYITTIDLGHFIRMYINHRPVFGLSPSQIGKAFKVLGEKTEGDKHWELSRNKLLSLLQESGEHLTETDMVEYLVTLLGYSENPEEDGSFTDDAIVALKQIPERITAPIFAEDIVGFSIQSSTS